MRGAKCQQSPTDCGDHRRGNQNRPKLDLAYPQFFEGSPAGRRDHRIPPYAFDVDFWVRERDHLAELGDTHCGHQQDDPGRSEEPPDDGELDDAPEYRAHHQNQSDGHPKREVVLKNEQRQQHPADQAHIPHCEVDHLRRPERQHDPHRQQAYDDARNRAVEHHLGIDSAYSEYGREHR